MLVRQIDSTPIGDYFHDSGITKVFEKLTKMVDEFEVDTDELTIFCDSLISSLKGLKTKIKKEESEASKRIAQDKVADLVQKGGIE